GGRASRPAGPCPSSDGPPTVVHRRGAAVRRGQAGRIRLSATEGRDPAVGDGGAGSVDGDGGDGEAEDLLEGADVLLGAAVTGRRAGVHRGRVEQTRGETAQRAGGVVGGHLTAGGQARELVGHRVLHPAAQR